MTKSYIIDNKSEQCVHIIIKEHEDESIIHIVLEDIEDNYFKDIKTTMSIDKHTTRDS